MGKEKLTKLPRHLSTDEAREYRLRYNTCNKIEGIMDATRKVAIVSKFKNIFRCIMDEESFVAVYPYLILSSAAPVNVMAPSDTIYADLQRYIPRLDPPITINDMILPNIHRSRYHGR